VKQSVLLLQESVLDELVDEGKHHGVGEGLDLERGAGGQGEEDSGHEGIEKRSSR
jgi:hypothetical protein